MVRSEVFLGLSRNDGQAIQYAEAKAFVDEEVVPRFPAGTTLVMAQGSYRSQTFGIVHERSLVLNILHKNETASIARIHELAALYECRFEQEAVLVAMSPAFVFGAAV